MTGLSKTLLHFRFATPANASHEDELEPVDSCQKRLTANLYVNSRHVGAGPTVAARQDRLLGFRFVRRRLRTAGSWQLGNRCVSLRLQLLEVKDFQ